MKTTEEQYFIYTDTGGTFTDCVVVNSIGEIMTGKSPTTYQNLEECFFNSIADAIEGTTMNLEEVLSVINTSVKKRKKVVVIASGDPNYYGIAKYLIDHLGKEKIEIIPNITTFQAAFAKIKESWDDAFLLSLFSSTLLTTSPPKPKSAMFKKNISSFSPKSDLHLIFPISMISDWD